MNDLNYMSPEEESSTSRSTPTPKPQQKPNLSPNTSSTSEPTYEKEYTIEQLVQDTKNKGKKLTIQTGSEASPEDILFIATEIIKSRKLTVNSENITKVKACMAVLAQGATSPKFAETRQCDLFDITVSVKEIRNFAKIRGTTFRKVARTLRNIAITLAEQFSIEGNLAKNYKLHNAEATIQELIWVSDFQTFNPDPRMPETVRGWLLDNYRNRFKRDI